MSTVLDAFFFRDITRTTWSFLLLCSSLSIAGLLASFTRHTKKNPPLPPGPPSKFLLGNLLDVPTSKEYIAYGEWAAKYGDISYAKVLGKDLVVVNSSDIANELMEKRSSIYSDRPDTFLLTDILRGNWNFAFERYGNTWRESRKAFHQKFNSNATASFLPIQEKRVNEMVFKLHSDPKNWNRAIQHMACGIIMDSIYGIPIKETNDPLVMMADKGVEAMVEASVPGRFLVDTFPILRHVPSWAPGTGWMKQVEEWKVVLNNMLCMPYQAAKDLYNAGTLPSSYLSYWFDRLSQMAESDPSKAAKTDKILRAVAATAYVAGFETSASAAMIFVLAMVQHPSVQARAHEELDRVIGSERMPTIEDRESLPYIDAICKEILRWRPLVPMGVAHRSVRDDVYKGMFIPKGSIVMANQWHMLMNESHFGPNTDSFIPERFLQPGVRDPGIAFGFGRRICPGRYLAENTQFMVVAFALHLFRIVKARDSMGKEVEVDPVFTDALTRHPEKFEADFVLRSEAAKGLLAGLEK